MSAEDFLTEYYDIKSILQLELLLKDLNCEYIEKGLLKEVNSEISILQILNLISKKESLPDIINIEFKTIPDGTKYILSCDTYHGGGVFKKVGEPTSS